MTIGFKICRYDKCLTDYNLPKAYPQILTFTVFRNLILLFLLLIFNKTVFTFNADFCF
jgi:hypothetical protein